MVERWNNQTNEAVVKSGCPALPGELPFSKSLRKGWTFISRHSWKSDEGESQQLPQPTRLPRSFCNVFCPQSASVTLPVTLCAARALGRFRDFLLPENAEEKTVLRGRIRLERQGIRELWDLPLWLLCGTLNLLTDRNRREENPETYKEFL